MLANGIKQTTTTAGTGNLTLSAVTGFVKMSDAFALNQPFQYTLLDSAGLLLECGIGYLSSSTVMVRAKVSASLVSGTYNDDNPSAVTLAGTTTVICSATAACTESMMPTVDGQSSSVSRYVTSAARNASFTPAGPSTQVVYYVPFLLREASPITSLAVNVTTGVASATAKVGIYACNEKGYPGAKLVESASLDLSTTGFKSTTLGTPLFLPPGWYFTAYVGSDGSSRISGYATSTANMSGHNPFGFNSSLVAIDMRSESAGSVTLPTTANTTTTASVAGNTAMPLTLLGVA